MKYQGVGSSPEFQELWEAIVVAYFLHPASSMTVVLSLKTLALTACLAWCSFPGKSGGAVSSSSLPKPCSPLVQPLGWREAGAQGWVLLCCGEEEQSWDVGIRQRPQ